LNDFATETVTGVSVKNNCLMVERACQGDEVAGFCDPTTHRGRRVPFFGQEFPHVSFLSSGSVPFRPKA
jgi:hypothetical protein